WGARCPDAGHSFSTKLKLPLLSQSEALCERVQHCRPEPEEERPPRHYPSPSQARRDKTALKEPRSKSAKQQLPSASVTFGFSLEETALIRSFHCQLLPNFTGDWTIGREAYKARVKSLRPRHFTVESLGATNFNSDIENPRFKAASGFLDHIPSYPPVEA
ncbi:hypothetical protein PF005_g6190, partial [Phytophthora fragariae]